VDGGFQGIHTWLWKLYLSRLPATTWFWCVHRTLKGFESRLDKALLALLLFMATLSTSRVSKEGVVMFCPQ
jgi:hypothetical protein